LEFAALNAMASLCVCKLFLRIFDRSC